MAQYHRYDYELPGAFDERIATAPSEEKRHFWAMAKDFSLRAMCSPLSSIQVMIDNEKAEFIIRSEWAAKVPERKRIYVVIGAPETPPHQHGQHNIPFWNERSQVNATAAKAAGACDLAGI